MSDHDPLLRALVLVALALGLTVPGTGARAESASSGRSSNKLEKTRLDTTPQRQMIHAPTFAARSRAWTR